MVYRPSIILMDEPLGALDKKLREHMQLEIKRIHRELGATIIYVTHDQEEAMTMSDRICLMNSGNIEQLGTPADLYFRPKTLFVADFLGESNLLRATIEKIDGDEAIVRIGAKGGEARALSNGPVQPSASIHVMIRPQNLAVTLASDGESSALRATVTDVMVTGSLTKIYMRAEDETLPELVAAFPTRISGRAFQIGDVLALSWHGTDAVTIVGNGKA
jgi:putative spermidine/putrescine transport system ATP-binding protein